MVSYLREEAAHPELRELRTFSPEWYWVWACCHIFAYPRLDPISCDNLLRFAKDAREDG